MFLQRTDGENHRLARLTKAIVADMRASFEARGEMSAPDFYREWAWRCKITPLYVRHVIQRKRWNS
jgi:hypothetical protein